MWEVPGKYLLNKMNKIHFYLVGVALCSAKLVQKISNAYSLEMSFFSLECMNKCVFQTTSVFSYVLFLSGRRKERNISITKFCIVINKNIQKILSEN